MSKQVIKDGRITISRPQFSTGKKAVVISVEDRDACTQFLEVELTLEDFTEALMGLGFTPCQLTVRGLHKVGKKIETKRVAIPAPEGFTFNRPKDTDAVWDEILPEYEVDGWVCSRYMGSQGSVTTDKDGNRKWNLTFNRWVEKTDD